MIGLPGTGLGGIFYIGLAFWMLIGELVRSARYRSSRLHLVAPIISLSVLIILVLAVEGYAIKWLLAEENSIYGIVPHVGTIQLGVLFSLFAIIHLARCIVIAKASTVRFADADVTMPSRHE